MEWRRKTLPTSKTKELAVVELPEDPIVVIIGAGVAGLACAETLYDYNFNKIIILEAGNRIGGRILTQNFGENVIDLGAQWCYGQVNNCVFEQAKVKKVLNTSTYIFENAQYVRSNGEVVANRSINQLTKIIVNLMKNNKILDTLGSLKDFLEKDYFEEIEKPEYKNISPNVAAEFFEYFLKSQKSQKRYSTKASDQKIWQNDISALGTRTYVHCEGEFMMNWRDKGFENFITNWLQVEDPEKPAGFLDSFVRLGKKVTLLKWNRWDGLVHVHCEDGEKIQAHHAVLTIPLGVLKEKKKVLFEPPLPKEKLNAIEGLGFNKICKIFIEFQSRFWPPQWTGFNLFWRHDELAELHETADLLWVQDIFGIYGLAYQSKVLLVWLVGDSVPMVEQLPRDEIERGCLYVLELFLRKMVISKIKNICWSQWCTDPNYAGAFSYRSVLSEKLKVSAESLMQPLMVLAQILSDDDSDDETHVDPAELTISDFITPLTIKPLVLFAGEATSGIHYSTVHGAVESGRREAKRLAGYYDKSLRSGKTVKP